MPFVSMTFDKAGQIYALRTKHVYIKWNFYSCHVTKSFGNILMSRDKN